MALQSVFNTLSIQAIKGMRMGTIRYGPVAAAASKAWVTAADASRQFKRDAAIASEEPFTEEEYEMLEDDSHQTPLVDGEFVTIHDDALRSKATSQRRMIRLFCQTIRESRETFQTTGIKSPISFFAHWYLEVGGICYELREHDPSKPPMRKKSSDRTLLYQEIGQGSRKIKLEVTTNKKVHPSTTCMEVGTTTLDDCKIIWAASLIFKRFGAGYDIWVDNCQHFSQLLAEVISGRDNREETRKFFDKRSIMKLPVAASWVIAPVYGCTVVLHHALQPDSSTSSNTAHEKVGAFLENMENFYLHPRVFAARRRQNPF